MSRLHDLLELCRRRPGLEILATALVEASLAALGEGLEGRVRGARLLRGIVHLRPGGGYTALIVHPRGTDAPTTSGTVWQQVEATGGPILLDVKRGGLRGPGAEIPSTPGLGLVFQSQSALLLREVTHVVSLPLIDATGALFGMISLELNCLSAVGRPLPWEAALPELEVLCALSAPWLAAHPRVEAPSRAVEDPLLPVVGQHLAALMDLLRIFAQQDETVLISGPTGSGKSRLARWVHARSARADGPFEALDLLTIPDDMQQGELFGWRRGSFTGAVRDHQGAVERAEGGTLFLDEIDKLSLRAQAALLQLLEERRFRPLGATGAARSADLRFLVGTNCDLRSAVAAGRFREDLYYRVNVLPVRLPGLSERVDEIPAWAEVMLARRHQEAKHPGRVTLDPEAASQLRAQPWPGNLRQLDNTVRRAWLVAVSERREGDLVVRAAHVERALALEQEPGRSPVQAMRSAAAALAATAVARHEAGAPLDLDLCAAFEGLALDAAETLLGSRDAAFRAFGRGTMVSARNHHKAWHRSAARVRELCAALGVEVPPGFSSSEPDA